MKHQLILFCLAVFLFQAVPATAQAAAASPGAIQAAVESAVHSEAEAQRRIDIWTRERDLLLEEARNLTFETQWLDLQVRKYRRFVAAQTERIEAMQRAQSRYAITALEMERVLLEYLEELENYVAESPPFLMEERQSRLDFLQATLDDADLTVGEKYRRFTEALNAEIEYGGKLEAGNQVVFFNGRELDLTVIRAGLLGYYCLTPDRRHAGVWNSASRAFVPLEEAGVAAVRTLENLTLTRQYMDMPLLPLMPGGGGL